MTRLPARHPAPTPSRPMWSAESDASVRTSPTSLGALLMAMQSECEATREAAWSTCYEQFYGLVRYHALCVLRAVTWLAEPSEMAADVASDVFAELPGWVRRYREEGRASWWLRQITIRTALRRKEALTGRWSSGRTAGAQAPDAGRRYVSFDEKPDGVVARLEAAEPEELLELNRRREALRASPDAQQRKWDAFLDLYVAGYEFSEIGARLGLTVGTARNWLCDIRKHLGHPRFAHPQLASAPAAHSPETRRRKAA